jgi:acyl-CoA synthetase (AMP-forming)/AMP-acid ligase II
MTIPYLLRRAASKFPSKEAIVSELGRWTYHDWDFNSNNRASALRRLGIGKEDKVATLFLNGNEVLETYAAIMKLGAVVVPLNARFSPGELSYIVNHSEATAVLFPRDFIKIIREMQPACTHVKQWIVFGEKDSNEFLSLDQIMNNFTGDDPLIPVLERDIACILYTAGTTGKPKGVLLSHRNCAWAAASAASDVDYKPEYRLALIFPLYHAAAFGIFITGLYLGCTFVTMKQFDPGEVMERVAREKVNRLVFPPTVWNFILQIPDLKKYDTSSVRSLGSGSETMPLETKRKLLSLFPNAGLGETYGMTETIATITTLKPADVLRKLESVGKPFVNTEIRIADENGMELPQGKVGEILVRGPNVMEGYHKDPEATEEALRGGWLHTGDLGVIDEEGFLTIVDRKKDMIISGGENIYSREIEEILYSHPRILEAAVIGVPDPIWGQKVHAVVVPKEGADLAEEEVIDYCRTRIASFKKPKSVQFVQKLPRSSAGKVLKAILRETWKESSCGRCNS